jgi:hypothetical protein
MGVGQGRDTISTRVQEQVYWILMLSMHTLRQSTDYDRVCLCVCGGGGGEEEEEEEEVEEEASASSCVLMRDLRVLWQVHGTPSACAPSLP